MRPEEVVKGLRDAPGHATQISQNGGVVEYFIKQKGEIKLVLVYFPEIRRFVKKYPANRDNVVSFDEKRGKMILENYKKLGAEIKAFPFGNGNKMTTAINKMLSELKKGKKVILFRGVA